MLQQNTSATSSTATEKGGNDVTLTTTFTYRTTLVQPDGKCVSFLTHTEETPDDFCYGEEAMYYQDKENCVEVLDNGWVGKDRNRFVSEMSDFSTIIIDIVAEPNAALYECEMFVVWCEDEVNVVATSASHAINLILDDIGLMPKLDEYYVVDIEIVEDTDDAAVARITGYKAGIHIDHIGSECDCAYNEDTEEYECGGGDAIGISIHATLA